MPKNKIILNPLAGKGNASRLIPEVEREFNGHHLEFDISLTQYPWHAAELAQEAIKEGYSTIIAAGGDGTANEVLNGVMLAKNNGAGTATLGVLPIGRGNDFSFSMGVPQDMAECCRAIAKGISRKIDVGFVKGGLYPEGRYFGNGIGVGFDATVGFVAAESRLTGFMAYMVAALKTLGFYYRAIDAQIITDSGELRQPCAMISIMNGIRMGGGFFMAPQGDPTDGVLDLCIVHHMPRFRLLPLIADFTKGTQGKSQAVKFLQTKKLTVKALEGTTLPAHADGETLCTAGLEISIELLPQQIDMIYQPAGNEA
jgi:diacylglycerol kinase (ATP)